MTSLLGGDERILFVDDETFMVDIGKQMLGNLGYEVVTSSSAANALHLFKTGPDGFDLVITDMTMPEMTGAQLAKEMFGINNDIRIILCTGFSEQINEKQVHDMGIHGFLLKPILQETLAHTVRKVLDSRMPAVSED